LSRTRRPERARREPHVSRSASQVRLSNDLGTQTLEPRAVQSSPRRRVLETGSTWFAVRPRHAHGHSASAGPCGGVAAAARSAHHRRRRSLMGKPTGFIEVVAAHPRSAPSPGGCATARGRKGPAAVLESTTPPAHPGGRCMDWACRSPPGLPARQPHPGFAMVWKPALARRPSPPRSTNNSRVHRPSVPGAVRAPASCRIAARPTGSAAASARPCAPVTPRPPERRRSRSRPSRRHHRARGCRGLGHPPAARARTGKARPALVGRAPPPRRGGRSSTSPATPRSSYGAPAAPPAACSATIPDFKLENRSSVAGSPCSRPRRRAALRRHLGFKPHLGPSCAPSHDAIVIAIGAGRARDLHVRGRDLDGVRPRDGLTYRANQSAAASARPPAHVPPASASSSSRRRIPARTAGHRAASARAQVTQI